VSKQQDELRRIAKETFGWDRLRGEQLRAMRALVAGQDVLVVLPTGAGKSAIYQKPHLVHQPVRQAQRRHPVGDHHPGVHRRAAGDHVRPAQVSQPAPPGQLGGDLDEQLRLQLRQIGQLAAHRARGVVLGQPGGGDHEREHLGVALWRRGVRRVVRACIHLAGRVALLAVEGVAYRRLVRFVVRRQRAEVHRAAQERQKEFSGKRWKEEDLVFTSVVGSALDAANVRRSFRNVVRAAGLNAKEWTPRELRHSFVSLLSDSGMPIEKISILVGHNGSRVTELVYRQQLRPLIHDGAVAMDGLFPGEP
jgi:hypothetical protein